MTRLRMLREPKRPWRQRRTVRNFDDDDSDETIIGLGFVETKNTAGTGATDQTATGD